MGLVPESDCAGWDQRQSWATKRTSRQRRSNCLTVMTIWSYAPDGCFIRSQSGRLIVGGNIRLESSADQLSENRLEAGSNTSTVALRVVRGDQEGNQLLRYNWATLFLEGINKGTCPSAFGKSRIWEWLCWQGTATTVYDRHIYSLERLHKVYECKCLVGKNTGLGSRGSCRQDELIL
jgi:hypothetical protein